MENTVVTPTSQIHPTAVISPTAKIGQHVTIGPFAIVEAHAVIGDHCRLAAHAIVRPYAILKESVFVDSFAVVGGDNQDLKFDPSIRSGVIIGAHTQIREGATIHRASYPDHYTTVGAHCLIMGNAHIAHDCHIGDRVIIANCALLAGHITVKSNAILSGGTVFHQFIRIGEYAMVSGNAGVGLDVPPFVYALERNTLKGLNVIGLRRAGFGASDVKDLKALYQRIIATRGNPLALVKAVREEGELGHSAAGQIFLAFFEEKSERGYLRAY